MASNVPFLWTLVIPAMILFYLFKEWMAKFSFELGKIIKSDALAADAHHHRSDALSTLLVIVSIIAARFNAGWADGICGIAVAGFIGWSGIHLAWSTLNRLMGEAPDEDLISKIITAASGIKGVMGVHGIGVHDYGNNKIVSMHIEVPGTIKTADSHKIETMVEENIRRRIKASAVVHIEACREKGEHPDPAGKVEQILHDTVKKEPGLTGFHAVHTSSFNHQTEVDFHLTMAPGSTVEECHRIEHELTGRLTQQFGSIRVNIHCEPEKKSNRVLS